jgi:hypothetical protein
MANYRFRPAEIEAMKQSILSHIQCETAPDTNGYKSAWRLRVALEGLAWCVRCSKRERAKRERKIALFESLTRSDLPNWQGCDFWHITDAPDQLPALPMEIAI